MGILTIAFTKKSAQSLFEILLKAYSTVGGIREERRPRMLAEPHMLRGLRTLFGTRPDKRNARQVQKSVSTGKNTSVALLT